MRRSPMYTGVALALGLTLALTLLWLLGGNPLAVRAAPPARPLAATINVTTTIQAAVDAAANGDTISIPARVYTENVNITGKVLTFLGAGAASTIVDGGSAGRVFSSTSDITLANLTLQNGRTTGDGSGLYTSGALTLTNVAVLSNTAQNSGGGAYASGAATLSGGLFQNNRSTSSFGGGLYAFNTLTLTGTQFISNTASWDGGGAYALGAATLSGGLFQNNQSNVSGSGLCANNTLTLTGTQFISNTASGAGGGAYANGSATLSGGLFQNNQSTGDNGGGLYANNTLTLTGTQFISNTASSNGGGVYQSSSGTGRLVNALFARNTAGGNGSAIYLGSSSTVALLHITIASPTVGAGAAVYVNAGTVGITNTIVASYTTGIQVAGGTVSSDYNLFYNAPTSVITGTYSLTGTDPLFVNPMGDNYRLLSGSPAIDRGMNVGVTTDLDGNPRPIGNGYDIGAYEAVPGLIMTKVASPEPVVAGTSLTYTISIVNSGYPTMALGLVLSDTLSPSTTLTVVDQTDDDGTALGFGGGTNQNTQWNDPRPAVLGDEWLGLANPSLYTGVYTSRVMDATSMGAWNNLRWTPWRPYGKELPNNRQAETAYAMGNANMLGNDVLLHLNESAGATAFGDSSGLGHNGACPAATGESCPAAGVTGRFNSALHFDGTMSNTVIITDATNPTRYAIELWVRPAVVADTSFILRTATVTGTALLPGPFSHLLGISSGRFLHLVSDSNGTHAITSTTVVTPGTWYHVVGTAQSGGEISLYVNGAEEARLTGLGTLWVGGDQYRLGSSYGPYGATTQYFSGDLDEVAVYSRTLSAAEITDHYLRGALRLSFQVRSCDDALCDTENWIGPGGLLTTTYSELNNPGLGLPSVTLTGVPNNRYFQYRALFTTDDAAYSPQLHDVRVGPNHYAVNASQGSCDALSASSFTCTLGSLVAGGSITIVVPVDLNPSALGIITNTVDLTSTWTDGSALSSTAVATSTVIAQSDIRIVKEDDWYGGDDPVNPGSPMTYTLRAYNAGPSTAWSVMVTDTLPITVSGVITPGGWSCDYLGNVLTCTVASLPRYQWQNIIVTGNAPLIEGIITNTVWITTATEISPTDNIYTETTWITPLADLSIAKTAYPDPVNPGETLTYTIVVTNSGPYTATNVVVTDNLQAGLVGTAVYSSSLWNCTGPGNPVICTLIPDLAPLQSVSFEITVTAPMSGVLRNDVTVASDTYDPDRYDPNTDNAVTTFTAVRPVADLAVAKSDAPDPVNAGTPLTYTITVTNAGPVPAGALTTTLSVRNMYGIGIPDLVHGAGWPYPTTAYVDSMPGLLQNMTVTLNSFNHTYPGDVSVLLVGPSGQGVVLMSSVGGGTDAAGVTLAFNDAGVALPASGALSSTVIYRPTNYGMGTLPAPAPSSPYGGSLSTFNGASPNGDWQLYVYDSVDSDGGSIAGWSLQLTTVTTDTVALTDTLPSGLTGVGVVAAPGWVCNNMSDVVSCEMDSLPVGLGPEIIIAATAPITGSVITNTVEIASSTADLHLADNTAAITTTVLAVADLQISKSASPEPVGAGQPLTYTLTFTNAGPSPVANVTVIDTLPTNVTMGSVPGGCTSGGNTITCTVAILPVNVPASLSFTVLAPPNAGVITNTGFITGTVIDTNTLNNTAVATTTVTPVADLSIIKTDTPDPVWVGGIITYTIVVSNSGPSVATNVTLTDGVPVSTTFQSIGSPGGWSCTTPPVGGTGNIVCTNPSLAVGAPATFIIAVKVDAAAPSGTVIANTATVSSDTADPTTPNTATATTTVSLHKLYLPVVFRNYAVAPDLIVSSLVVTSTGVQAVIKNQGDAAVTQVISNEFWIDLYVNPNPPPTGVNQVWKDGRSAHGIVWGVTNMALPLAPGSTLTLTVGGSYYRPDLSDMAWPLPVGTVIYAQVDSANTLTNYGAVLENHEIIGGTYNNITHTLSTSAVMGEIALASVLDDGPTELSDHLPPRP
jgi:uncharacterized repeat protein (TIGR01451 family)